MHSHLFFQFLFILLQLQVLKSESLSYIGAVVEYNPLTDDNKTKMLEENIKNYEMFIKDAKNKKADIVVFPEGGLTNDVLSVVPHPMEGIVPCGKPEQFTEIMTKLSCAAIKNSIYVVVNIPELRNVENGDNGIKKVKYNTNVAFDRSGTVVARYAKYNLFDEFNTSKPDNPEHSIFNTDFGVNFGTFICFDILFQEPSLSLAHKYGITDFLFTSQWFSELPFLTALQVQRGWAEAHNVNLLASGYNNPRRGSTGSGIFNGVYGSLIHFMSKKKGSKLLVAEVKKHGDCKGSGQKCWNGFAENGNKMNTSNSAFDDFYLLADQIELFTSEVIGTGVILDKQVCSHGNFCCKFDVDVRKLTTDTKGYNYRAVAFNGVRKFGLSTTGGVQSCGIILCNGPGIFNCTHRANFTFGIYEFAYIKIEGSFKKRNSMQIPSTLIVGNEMDTLKPKHYEFLVKNEENSKKVVLTLDWSVDNLQTFAIWGRDFSQDGKKPSLPASSAPPLISLSFVFVFFVMFAILCR